MSHCHDIYCHAMKENMVFAFSTSLGLYSEVS